MWERRGWPKPPQHGIWVLALPALMWTTLVQAAEPPTDPCQCLNWKEVYDSKRVTCGEGLEFYLFENRTNYSLLDTTLAPKMGFTYHEFCGSFFHQMDNNYCVNVGHFARGTTEWYGGQWCYVSKDCKSGHHVQDKESVPPRRPFWLFSLFHRAELVPRDIAWKVCTPGQDRGLRDMEPEDLFKLSDKMGSVLGFVSKMAYSRLMPPEHTWDTVKYAVAAGDLDRMPALLQEAIRSNEPIVIDTDPEGHKDQHIIRGKTVYYLELNLSKCGRNIHCHERARDVGEL